ncbi:MAG: hypothetical protein IJX75_05705 [Clostridia bacterium]|nr:hypothetical protein [Clostridia bacterium]
MSRKNRAPKDFQEKTKKKLVIDNRILGIILAVISLATLILPLTAVVNGKVQSKLFITTLFAASPASFALLSMLGRYVFVAFAVATIVLGVLTAIKPEKGETFIPYALLTLTCGTAVYFFAMLALTAFIGARAFDVITLAVSVLACAGYSFLLFKKLGKENRFHFIQYLLSVLFSFLILLSIGMGKAPKGSMEMLVIVVFALAGILFVFNAVRVRFKANDKISFITYIAEGAVALIAFLVALISSMGALSFLLPLVAALAVFGQFEFAAIRKKHMDAVAADNANQDTGMADEFIEEQPQPEVAAATMSDVEVSEEGYHIEEYAEAVAYTGGPVAGVEMAEEVNKTETADYDFYNTKSFDAFIATLDAEERNQFTELFLLRYQGSMPEIPEYVVGGDNREFFRKIFIYLGQYRERIPSGLLTKMYNYSVRVS